MNEKQTVFILVGPSGSGKSHYCKMLKKQRRDINRVNRDCIREMLDPTEESWQTPSFENLVSKIEDVILRKLINIGNDVIVDNTHLKVERIEHITDVCTSLASTTDRQINTVVVPMKDGYDLELIMKHNNERPNRHVPIDVIKKQYNLFNQHGYIKLATEIGNKFITENELYSPAPNLPSAIIVDIDGTIANCNNIRSPYDYTKIMEDNFIESTWKTAKAIADVTNSKIFIFTGRDYACREATETWLLYHGVNYDLMVMRNTGDYRKDAIVKKELFDKYIADQYKIEAVFDDRLQVCRMWHSLGLPLFRVGNPDADF